MPHYPFASRRKAASLEDVIEGFSSLRKQFADLSAEVAVLRKQLRSGNAR